jgi:signal transduction histidine kinase
VRIQWAGPVRGAAYLLGSLLTAIVTLIALPLFVLPSLAHAWADLHRQRAGRLLGVRVQSRPASRRDLLWPLVHVATGLPFGLTALVCLGNIVTALVAMTLWWTLPPDTPQLLGDVAVTGWLVALTVAPWQIIVLTVAAWWVGPPLARAHARICLALLSPSAAQRLSQRLETVTRTRAEALDAHANELRRIERDLHDGVQARLVAVAVRLGVVRESLTDSPQGTARLIREAHEGIEEAMTQLRAVVRTAYPPILADRGLDGALAALAADSGVPARLHVGELGALPAAVEAVAYHVVAEALTNAAKHSHATQAEVHVLRTGARLALQVTDNGAGGADETRGTGIAGIRRRVLALDGTVDVTSPPGGPTTITAEVPCAS